MSSACFQLLSLFGLWIVFWVNTLKIMIHSVKAIAILLYLIIKFYIIFCKIISKKRDKVLAKKLDVELFIFTGSIRSELWIDLWSMVEIPNVEETLINDCVSPRRICFITTTFLHVLHHLWSLIYLAIINITSIVIP